MATTISNVGIPVRLLQEAVELRVTIELKTGEIYRGFLMESDRDTMNCQLAEITYTDRVGQKFELEHAFVRGSKIRFIILPDILKNSPIFKRTPRNLPVRKK